MRTLDACLPCSIRCTSTTHTHTNTHISKHIYPLSLQIECNKTFTETPLSLLWMVIVFQTQHLHKMCTTVAKGVFVYSEKRESERKKNLQLCYVTHKRIHSLMKFLCLFCVFFCHRERTVNHMESSVCRLFVRLQLAMCIN